MIRSGLKFSAALRPGDDLISKAIQRCNVILVSTDGGFEGSAWHLRIPSDACASTYFLFIDLNLEFVLLIQRVTELRGSIFKRSYRL